MRGQGSEMSFSLNQDADGRGATAALARIVRENCSGQPVGSYSVCSANRYVLESAMERANADASMLCIESTSNQVNQFGGYTGMDPESFASFVKSVAMRMNFPPERILLGGDHLGPHVWKNQKAEVAMANAADLVKHCVLAGYTKIHLDASMHCADDAGERGRPLPDETVSERAAQLCAAAEQAHRKLPASAPAPLYIVGTEVPVPGGEQLAAHAPPVTSTQDLSRTLQLTQAAFVARGLQAAWERVIAVVVQPGVEFGDAAVFNYDAAKSQQLSIFATTKWNRVYEAHSTDYQTPQALSDMVRDHFAILKVGPWLTFAFREAVFALARIEEETLGDRAGVTLSKLIEVLEHEMISEPEHWKSYYHGSADELRLARKFSYSDRSRYYWPRPRVDAALQRLVFNLDKYPAPAPILSQYLPTQAAELRSGTLVNEPRAMIRSKINEVLTIYSTACGTHVRQSRAQANESKEVGQC
jgi:D-tagatose-1,6-bisphosphate aldolase subunit GatZ/KbaZ